MRYDPKVVNYETLARESKNKRCADRAFPGSTAERKVAAKYFGKQLHAGNKMQVRRVKDSKYYASRTPLAKLPMTEAQAAKLNGKVSDPRSYDILSPRQQALLKKIKAHPKAGWPTVLGQPLVSSWPRTLAVANRQKGSTPK
ncbi:MAG: hypothetical protein V3W41_20390 [Planctomycetota bacterium]